MAEEHEGREEQEAASEETASEESGEQPVQQYPHPGLETRALNRFPEAAVQPVARTVPEDPDAEVEGELFQYWSKTPGGHKWLHYFELYEEIFLSLGSRPARMLEIGVFRGGSVRMWSHCLPPGSTVVGIDLDETCKQFEDVASNLHVRIGSQADPDFLKSVAEEFGPFDFILDDGSHHTDHMIDSFTHLFPEALVPGGQYLVEDTHTNYWLDYRDSAYSFVDFSKDLIDMMHAIYLDRPDERFFREEHSFRLNEVQVPEIAAMLKEIRFRASLVLFQKHRHYHLPVSRLLQE
ncbi:class I SAM-dependent methyltransferase [bacterium]|nr:class I SAM-dependent methyltransferase [bacterium]